MKKYKYSILWAILMLAGCTLKLNSNINPEQLFPYQDKAIHFCIFAVLGFLITVENRKARIKTIIICTLYGATIEIIQSFLPWRSFEVLDIVSDSLGAGAGIIAAKLLINRILSKK